MLAGDPLVADCPLPWRRRVTGRSAPRFADRPTGFEQFAAHLWQMADGHARTYEVTRATAGCGRDAIGEYLIALRYQVMAPA